jgi:hypothetical protein
MSSKKVLKIAIVLLLGIAGSVALGFDTATVFDIFIPETAQAQTPELTCAVGFTAIPQLVVINPATGRVRQLGCMDASGNLSFPATNTTISTPNGIGLLTLGTGAGNFGASTGSTVSFGGNSLNTGGTLSTAAGSISGIASSVPIFAATSAFAGLGTVPSAGAFKFCTDCTTAATCAGSGTGHMAVSNGTNWTCQ